MAVYAQRLRTTYLSARAQRQTLTTSENVSYPNASAGLAEWIGNDTRSQPHATEYIAQLIVHSPSTSSIPVLLSAFAVVSVFFPFHIAVDLGLYFSFKSHQQMFNANPS